MTARQQNRNVCVVGKAKDGMTIDTSKIKIEDVSERIISIDGVVRRNRRNFRYPRILAFGGLYVRPSSTGQQRISRLERKITVRNVSHSWYG
ncbi:hypothetical protein OEL47_004447 [Salmonella enterica]|nr:hypothetical protein [Salmonella enterica]EJX7785893.1 hypothetical protein [Salmonella enterica]